MQTTRAYVFRVHRIHNRDIQVEVQTVKIHNRIISQDPRKTNIQTRNQNSSGQIQQKYTNIIDPLVIHKHHNLSRNGKSVVHIKAHVKCKTTKCSRSTEETSRGENFAQSV